jgi:anti-sigma B factor antagonist
MLQEENEVRLSLAEGQAPTVVVKGEIDAVTVPRLRSCLAAAGAEASREVVVDLAGLTFIDSAALGVLTMAYKELSAEGCGLVITNVPPAAMMVFRLSGLVQILTVRPARRADSMRADAAGGRR